MSCKFIHDCILPGTSQSMVNHICFTDYHHYGRLNHEDTVAKYKGTVLGESLDFDKMDRLIEEQKQQEEETLRQRGIDRSTPVTMEHVLKELCGEELLKRMRDFL